MKAQVDVKEDGTTQYIQYFDEDDEVFQAIAGNEGQPVKEIDFTLRTQEHIDAINAELSWLSAGLGLGANFWKFDGVSVKTATEVISEDSEAYKTRQHHLINVNDVVYDLVYAICELEEIKTNSIAVIPDDSIIEDKNTIQVRAMSEVAQGLMSKTTYLTKIKGMSDDEAQAEIDSINNEKQSNQEMFGFTNKEDSTAKNEE